MCSVAQGKGASDRWNGSRSVPVGLYTIDVRSPARSEFATLRLPEPMRGLADARGYLPAHAVLIKPVAALAPDLVCRNGPTITINGQRAAQALTNDKPGRPLPQWNGCHRIEQGQLFVLADDPHSFDSRYFGPVDARQVVGTATFATLGTLLGAPSGNRRVQRPSRFAFSVNLPMLQLPCRIGGSRIVAH